MFANMTNFAIIRAKGKQYLVSAGDVIKIDARLDQQKQLDKLFAVLLYSSENTTLIGTPLLDNVKVKAKLVASFKGPKIKVQKFKPKVRYKRNKSHRQNITKIQIDKINLVKKVN